MEKNNNEGTENRNDNINLPFIFGFPNTFKQKPTEIGKKSVPPTPKPSTPATIKQETKTENIPKDPRILMMQKQTENTNKISETQKRLPKK